MTVNTAPRKEHKLAPLVGKKCLIDIQGQGAQALRDSDSKVTIIDEQWKEREDILDGLDGNSQIKEKCINRVSWQKRADL